MKSSALVEKVQSQVTPYSKQTWWIGLSGGVDSVVLLHCLSRLPYEVNMSAIYVDHGLSEKALLWRDSCALLCEQLNVPFHSVSVNVEKDLFGLEQAARLARYQAFEATMGHDDCLILGHHLNDQVETFMMRLMRGSGLTGLTAMVFDRKFAHGRLLRPLLDISRKEIERYAIENSLQWVEDESNQDIALDRNWWRQELLPQIADRYPQSEQSIIKTIAILQDEHRLLSDLIEPIYRDIVDAQQRVDINKLSRQSRAIRCQVIRKWQENTEHYPLLSDKQIHAFLNDFINSRHDAMPLFAWQGNEIRRHNGKMYIMSLLPQVSNESQIFNGQSTTLIYGSILVSKADKSSMVAGLKVDEYELVFYNGTLKAKPYARPSKVLKKWFQEFAIPPWVRPHWPILMKNDVVAAVPGLFVCEGFVSDDGWQLKFCF